MREEKGKRKRKKAIMGATEWISVVSSVLPETSERPGTAYSDLSR